MSVTWTMRAIAAFGAGVEVRQLAGIAVAVVEAVGIVVLDVAEQVRAGRGQSGSGIALGAVGVNAAARFGRKRRMGGQCACGQSQLQRSLHRPHGHDLSLSLF